MSSRLAVLPLFVLLLSFAAVPFAPSASAISDGQVVTSSELLGVGRLEARRRDGLTTNCTVSLISRTEALTAEHCLFERDVASLRDIKLFFGGLTRADSGAQEVGVVGKRISTRDYRGPRDSLAILTLSRPIDGVAPLRVNREGGPRSLYEDDAEVLAIGWGQTAEPGWRARVPGLSGEESELSPDLRSVEMKIGDPTSSTNGGAIRVRKTEGGGPQSGDSGGPLLARQPDGWIIVGVYTGESFYMKTNIDPLFEN